MSVERAYLTIEDRPGPLYCWFNPTTLALRRGARWKDEPTIAQSAQKPTYLGGEGETITLNLLLHAEDDRTGSDVQDNVQELLGLVEASKVAALQGQTRPRTMTLHWGSFASCLMIARSVDVTIELFDVDGTPLRATVTLALSQYQPEAGQGTSQWTNPTTRATQARRVHHIQAGDNVHLVAQRHFRDPARWHTIAEFNELDDPLRLRAGDVLVVPMEET
jgi:nucleoid-associated protein YgaU